MAASADLINEANQCLSAKLVDNFNGDVSPTSSISNQPNRYYFH